MPRTPSPTPTIGDEKLQKPTAPTVIPAEFISPADLAARLGVSVRTLQQWHRVRKGPPLVAVGNFRAYRLSGISEWLAARETALQRNRTR